MSNYCQQQIHIIFKKFMASRSQRGHFAAPMLTVQKLHVKAISPNHKSENIQAVLLTHMNSLTLAVAAPDKSDH